MAVQEEKERKRANALIALDALRARGSAGSE
jgi:hypothetical protein